jgi:hypothetical protein
LRFLVSDFGCACHHYKLDLGRLIVFSLESCLWLSFSYHDNVRHVAGWMVWWCLWEAEVTNFLFQGFGGMCCLSVQFSGSL